MRFEASAKVCASGMEFDQINHRFIFGLLNKFVGMC
jgi:hypothetical protein